MCFDVRSTSGSITSTRRPSTSRRIEVRMPGLWERGGVAPFAIVGAKDGDFLGATSLIFPEDQPPTAGYWVARWGRNRGVATVALILVANWGFDTLGVESITLATMLGNLASERVAQKAGFALIGETSDYRPPRNPETVYNVRKWERKNASGTA